MSISVSPLKTPTFFELLLLAERQLRLLVSIMSVVGSALPQAICDLEALHGYRLGETVRSDGERTFVLGTLWLVYITVINNWLFIAVVANDNLLKQYLEMSHWIIKALSSIGRGSSPYEQDNAEHFNLFQ